jgi:hypothetical protein
MLPRISATYTFTVNCLNPTIHLFTPEPSVVVAAVSAVAL